MQKSSPQGRLWFLAALILPAFFLLGLFAAMQAIAAPDTSSTRQTEVELFVSEGCPHCAAAHAFIDELARERHDFHVTIIDVRRDPRALARLQELSRAAEIVQPGVPTIRIGTELIVGFGTPATTGARIREALNRTAPTGQTGAGPACNIDENLSCTVAEEEAIEIPFTGRKVTVEDVGLPLFTIVIGLLDGFNPCSMWVLILMISMLAGLRDRRKMLAIAGTFVVIQGAAYFAFMAAWLNLFLLIGLSRASEVAIGLLAIAAGMINLKDFLAINRGITLSIPAAAKPGIYARLRALLYAERMGAALAGAAALAVLVQIVELMCTSGFPALYTRILTLRQLDQATYYGYLMLYNMMYMLDDVIVLGVGVATLSQRRLQEKEGRLLKLIGGIVMLCLGLYLLVLR